MSYYSFFCEQLYDNIQCTNGIMVLHKTLTGQVSSHSECRMQHSYPAQSMPSGVYTQCSAAPCMVPQRSSAGIAQLPLLSAIVYRYILLRLLVTPGIAAGCALIRMDRLKADGLHMFLCSCCPPCGAWPSSRHGQRPLDRLLPARL